MAEVDTDRVLQSTEEEPLYPLPPTDQIDILKEIHDLVRYDQDNQKPENLKAAVQRALKYPGFKDYLVEIKCVKLATFQDCFDCIEKMFYWFLAQNKLAEASVLAWGPSIFTPEPRSVRLIWQALETSTLLNILGASSQGKTYSPAIWLLLNWVMDPDHTRIIMCSIKLEKAKKDIFSHVQRCYKSCLFKLPGETDTESISVDKKLGMGIYIETASGSVLKGIKRQKRATPHPIFGDTTRLFILIDEAQEVPESFFELIPNIQAGVGSTPFAGKLIMAANPSNQFSPYGVNCEPEGGWEEGGNKTDVWTSKTGWTCVRLNGMKCENVILRKEIYHNFLTYKNYLSNLRQCLGDVDHPRMWTYVYGMFPPMGDRSCLITPDVINKCKKEWIFAGPTESFASCDPAYTGDDAAFAWGRTGRSKSYRLDNGEITYLEEPKYVVQVDGITVLPKGNTTVIAMEVMKRCQVLGVKPEKLAVDSTGNTGVADQIEELWNRVVLGVKETDPRYNERVSICAMIYSHRASEVTILAEDSMLPKDMYRNLATELWFATAKWMQADVVGIGKGVDEETMRQLCGRRGVISDKARKSSVEGKDTYKGRGNKSPDRADSFTMLIQAVRLNSPWKPGLVSEGVNDSVDLPLPPGTPTLAQGLNFSDAMQLQGFGISDILKQNTK